MVVLTGQVATTHIGTDAFQEVDMVGIARSVTKWCTLVKDVRDLPRAMHEAFAIATAGRPGPVLIDLPKDVTAATLRERPDVTPRIARRMQEKAALQRLQHGDDATQVIEQLSHALTNKFLHAPTHALNHASDEDRDQLVNMLRRLHQLKHSE